MAEKPQPSPNSDLEGLAQRVCDGNITDAEREQLEQKLATDSATRRSYLDYLELNAALVWRYRTGAGQSERANPGAGVSAGLARRSRRRWLMPPWATVFAITASVLLAAWVANRPDNLGEAPGGGPAAQAPSTTSAIATLRESSAAIWRDAVEPLDVGDRVAAGRMRIGAGRAELVIDSGVRVVIEGPGEFSLLSAEAAFLQSGKVAVHVPEQAIGFELSTPTSKLIDRGTEFGVVADESGATEVHVFRGQVDLMYESENADEGRQALSLLSHQARRVLQPETIGEDVDFSLDRFRGLADVVNKPVEWRLADDGNGHFYQLVFFDRAATWQEAASNAFNRHHGGLPGHLVTITSEAEHRFLVEQLLGDRQVQNVWIGLTDVLREGYFQWVTGEPFAYEQWQVAPAQQPDNFIERDGHGGEDYGTFTRLPGFDWYWNDLSNDSIHQSVAVAIVEYEPPIEQELDRSLLSVPVTWKKEEGGNGHHYRLVLSLQPLDWEELQQRAASTSLVGIQGELASLETEAEREFVTDSILKVCGIPENVVGLSGEEGVGGLVWSSGSPLGGVDHASPNFPTELVYGQYRWLNQAWRLQTVPANRAPPGWFGYLVEYATSDASSN